jgi:hypothetical protein
MKNELNALIQEIITFSDVIAFIDDPAGSDFQNACQLFSGYLENRFSDIKSKSHISSCEEDIKWTENEIAKLSDLITLPDDSATPYIQWTRNLFQHCEELQSNKIAIA